MIVTLWNSGQSYKAVAAAVKVSYHVVHRVIDDARRRGEAINVWDRKRG
jgi:transposase